MGTTHKLYIKKGKEVETRYMLRINQIEFLSSGIEKGTIYFLIEMENEKRMQLAINSMVEKGLVY